MRWRGAGGIFGAGAKLQIMPAGCYTARNKVKASALQRPLALLMPFPQLRERVVMSNHSVPHSGPRLQVPSQPTDPATVQRLIRESLGLPSKPESQPTLPQEGHVCDMPMWSYSKSRIPRLHIDYEDGSFFTLTAPEGIPGPSFPGYLDCILFYGQGDLFSQEHKEISVYRILRALDIAPDNGRNYAHFKRDMHRAFVMYIMTDRFRDPQTGQRSHVDYFRVLRRMKVAKNRKEVSTFFFDDLFLKSVRSGYLKRLDFEFALHLDKEGKALARFLYGHLLKRIGEKSLYQRNVSGFLNDIGLGQVAQMGAMRLNERLKRTVFPALDLLKGEVLRHYEMDNKGTLFFVPTD
jgi:hypothetical protein